MKCHRLIGLLSAAVLLGSSVSLRAQTLTRSDSEMTASVWWMNIWAGKYAESWDELAQYAQAKVSRDDWEAYVRKVYEPLGRVKARRVVKIERLERLPDARDQQRMAVEYESTYSKVGVVVETFTLMSEKCDRCVGGATWRVASYTLRQGTSIAPFEQIPR